MKGLSLNPLFLVTILVCLSYNGFSQKVDKAAQKLEKFREENWPPQRTYAKMSLGYALQQKFKQHAQYCGFDIGDSSRDYVPADIGKFIGKRTMRTKVETADIRGGGLMYYIFHESETTQPFNLIKYIPSNIIQLHGLSNQFVINPDENFDAFILTKTCGGYLKAALDAGIEPPYAAFKMALDKDSRRESSVLALSGSFLSPLQSILDANDDLTTAFLMKLWKFYADHPSYANKAYFLREFEGVLIRHVTTAEENKKIALEGSLDLNGPLPAHLKAAFGTGANSTTSFSGNDWETILYADFEDVNDRVQLFSKLPSPEFIRRYFENLQPIFQKSKAFPLMTEGVDHEHFLIVEGIPEDMSTQFWILETVKPGIYEGTPSFTASYFKDEAQGTSGCRFTIKGKPMRTHFEGSEASKPSRLNLSYSIRSKYPVGGEYIRFYVNEEIQTSSHPVAGISKGEFDLSKKEDRKFAFQWQFELDIEDQHNPIDFATTPFVGNLTVRSSNKNLHVKLAKIEADALRKKFFITIETLETYPLDKIDDTNMIAYNLSLETHLKSKFSDNISIRPIKGILYFPSIKPDIPMGPNPNDTIPDPDKNN